MNASRKSCHGGTSTPGLVYFHLLLKYLRGRDGSKGQTQGPVLLARIVVTVVGFVTLLITASGVFTEMQQALNVIWRAQSQERTVAGLLRARALSLGLVASLGFLLLVSLAIGALLTALGNYMSAAMAFAQLILRVLNFIASFALITLLFAAIYKVLPDASIAWRDDFVGALGTSFLFTVGKFLIGLYLGSNTIASGYGAAGGLILLALWVYYSAQTFLLGAESPRYTRINMAAYEAQRIEGRVNVFRAGDRGLLGAR